MIDIGELKEGCLKDGGHKMYLWISIFGLRPGWQEPVKEGREGQCKSFGKGAVWMSLVSEGSKKARLPTYSIMNKERSGCSEFRKVDGEGGAGHT